MNQKNVADSRVVYAVVRLLVVQNVSYARESLADLEELSLDEKKRHMQSENVGQKPLSFWQLLDNGSKQSKRPCLEKILLSSRGHILLDFGKKTSQPFVHDEHGDRPQKDMQNPSPQGKIEPLFHVYLANVAVLFPQSLVSC